MNRALKGLAGTLVFATRLHRLLGRGSALVLVFHRIDDRLEERGDPLSCSAERFRRFCEFLRKHFQVVGLQDLVERLVSGGELTGLAAITFDDGYAEAFERGAPVLREFGLPGTFFVVTDFVGTTEAAPWDSERSIASRWMDWQQVRTLREQGFEVGAHTRRHPDLTGLEPDEAREEILGSKLRLERELGGPVQLFSFPFGAPASTGPTVRALAREAGFCCCVAAHGGVVTQRSDPFDLERINVSPWFLYPQQLGLETLLQRQVHGTAGSLRSR